MQDEVMVHKVNSIARFFASYPHEEAVVGVAEHLQHFWEPRMRRWLLEYVDGGGEGLHDLIPEAVRRLRPTQTAVR